MQLRPDSAAAHVAQDGGPSETDRLSALTARVDEIDSFVKTASELVDPKALKELRRTLDALSKRDPKFEERVSHTVSVLADRIETVAKTVSTSSAALAAKDGEIAQLRRELEVRLSQLDASVLEPRRGTDAAELADVRRALDELSKATKQRMPRGLEGRIDELGAKFELVAQRVDSVSSTVSTTAAGLAGREGDLNALRKSFEAETSRVSAELAELRRAVDPRTVSDLRQELKELADETARRQHSSRQLIGQSATKIDALAERLESVAASLDSTSDRIGGTEQHALALRTYLEDNGKRVHALLGEHREALTTLSARADTHEQVSAESALAGDERLASAVGKLDELAGRLDGIDAAVASATQRLDANSGALEGVERRLEDSRTRVDDLVADLLRALDEFPDPNRVAEQLTPRLDELAEQTVSLTERLAGVETSVLEQLGASAVSTEDLERLGDEHRETARNLSARIGTLEASVESTVGTVTGTHEELSVLQAHVDEAGGRLGSLIAEQKQLLSALAARTDALEHAESQAALVLGERVADLGDRLDGIAGRFEPLAATMASTADQATGTQEGLSELRAYVEDAKGLLSPLLTEHRRSLEEHGESLAALGAHVVVLEQAGADAMSVLEERRSETGETVSALSQRVEVLAAGVNSTVTRLGVKERELAELQTHSTESSARIESIVEDIRDALGALPDASPDALDALTSKLESAEAGVTSLAGRLARLEAVRIEQVAAELTERFDRIDVRIATVAAEMGRAKTLWPVALRSLEARLNDLVSHGHDTEHAAGEPPSPGLRQNDSYDPLAGLRDSLHAMESVVEEVARASDAWASETGDPPKRPADELSEDVDEAVAGGARIVPFPASDP